MAKRVAVLGGGVAGLSAAHELVERGFAVDVFERRAVPGGKARSMSSAGTGVGGRADLPGEHGFRFFPGFYKHLPDTMKRIPYEGNRLGVFQNLVAADAALLAHQGNAAEIVVRFPSSIREFRQAFVDVFSARLGLSLEDVLHFVDRLVVILTSCEERRLAEYEKIAWWDFVGAAGRSTPFQQYLAEGITRSLVAMKAEIGSTRTVGDILIQLILNAITPGESLDRVLSGPTNAVWLTPWKEYLAARGVAFHFRTKVLGLEVANGQIAKVRVADVPDHAHGEPVEARDVTADYYVLALPVEVAAPLMTPELVAAAPPLGELGKLQYKWMNGIQFYLREDVPLVNGHAIYVDSPFALTSISQAQFWTKPLTEFGDGTVHGCLSVDVSDWDTPGILYGKPAMELSADEIKAEVWAQLRRSLEGYAAAGGLSDANLAGWHLDRDIRFPNPREDINLEPLLVNVVNSWQYRPEAVTPIRNLFLASDYVRTFTDLATMEGANEAARRAVNGILRASGSDAAPCVLWPLREPAIFEPFRALDAVRFKLGHRHEMPPSS
jgi:15-cis-phytoene desaturase